MFKSLYAKLAAVFIGLLTCIGILYIFLTIYTTRLYLQELTQQFNRTLAKDLVEGTALIHNGEIDHTALEHVFHSFMDINPHIEVYLLDWQGQIMTYDAPPGKIKRGKVALAPIIQLLNETRPLPILGDDPRDVNRKKVFSATRIGPTERPEGYLYVVLGGEKFDSVANLLEESYLLRLSTWTAIGIMVFGLIAGLLLFGFLTRRLTILSSTMKSFQESGLQRIPVSPMLDTQSPDEIGQIGATFKKMARRIMQQMQALKKTDALRRELVANVSHDLRTPLASLQGYLETLLLKERTLSESERRKYLEVALKHSKTLTQLVAELFELAKLDSKDQQLQTEPFSLSELVQDLLLKLQVRSEQTQVELKGEIPQDLPFVMGDIALIERVLENIVDNAFRHTSPPGSITLTLHARDQSIVVQVTDTGCGIQKEDLPHIFDRFYQAKNHPTNKPSGAGLGLAIAKRILELHDIPIHVDSQQNIGTTFSFALPASQV